MVTTKKLTARKSSHSNSIVFTAKMLNASKKMNSSNVKKKS